jgi:hypothetical protein
VITRAGNGNKRSVITFSAWYRLTSNQRFAWLGGPLENYNEKENDRKTCQAHKEEIVVGAAQH